MSDTNARDAERIDVRYVAHLSRLHLNEEEIRTFQAQLNQIVDYVRKINELDLTGVEPTSHAGVIRNVFRRDETRPGLERDIVVENAPAHVNDQFMVPKIME